MDGPTLAIEQVTKLSVFRCAKMSAMDRDWRDDHVFRLEKELRALEDDVRRRFWERDQRILNFLLLVMFGLACGSVGVALARAFGAG